VPRPRAPSPFSRMASPCPPLGQVACSAASPRRTALQAGALCIRGCSCPCRACGLSAAPAHALADRESCSTRALEKRDGAFCRSPRMCSPLRLLPPEVEPATSSEKSILFGRCSGGSFRVIRGRARFAPREGVTGTSAWRGLPEWLPVSSPAATTAEAWRVYAARTQNAASSTSVPFPARASTSFHSAAQKRILLFAEYLEEQLLLTLPHRQFVFTLPKAP
jgi:hypothetical protein